MTARWVVEEVAPARDIDVTWEPISLLFKNDPDPGSDYREWAVRTHGMLRVMESIRTSAGNDGVFKAYWDFATRVHHDKSHHFDIADAIERLGFDRAHAEAFDDDRWDGEIRTRMEEGLDLAGEDIGTPIIAFDAANGQRLGIFGPVITRVPKSEDAIRLWDGMVAVTTVPGFWELKRTRTEEPEFGDRPGA